MTRSDTHRYLVAYDIPDDRRRLKIATALQTYGDRVQYSVFVVDAADVRIRRLRRQLESLIDAREDSVLVCDVGLTRGVDDDRFTTLGRRRPVTDSSSFVV